MAVFVCLWQGLDTFCVSVRWVTLWVRLPHAVKICVSVRWVTLWVRPPDIVAMRRSDYCPRGAIFLVPVTFYIKIEYRLFISSPTSINFSLSKKFFLMNFTFFMSASLSSNAMMCHASQVVNIYDCYKLFCGKEYFSSVKTNRVDMNGMNDILYCIQE